MSILLLSGQEKESDCVNRRNMIQYYDSRRTRLQKGRHKDMKKRSFQYQYGKALCGAAIFLTWVYLQTGLYRFVMPAYRTAFRMEQWCGLLLAAAAVLFLCIRLGQGPESRQRIKSRFREFLSYEQIYLVYTFLWYIVSVARYQHVMGGEQFRNNDPWMFATGMMAFLLFPLAQYIGSRDARRVLERMLKTVVLPFACFTGWMIWQYFHQHYVTFPSGQQLQMSPDSSMLFSELSHNYLARQAMVMVGLSLYMIATQNGAEKCVYTLCLAVFLVSLILTNSRTSWYMTSAMLTCAGFLACMNPGKRKKGIVRAVVGLLAAAAIALSCHWLRGEIFVLLDRALSRQAWTEAAAAEETAGASASPVYLLRPLSGTGGTEPVQQTETKPAASSAASGARRLDDNLSTIGNRLPLYRASLKAMFSSRYCFLFGVTPANVVSLLRNYEGVSDSFAYDHAHNFFLQMGVSFGVPTMAAAIAFAVSLVMRSVRILLLAVRRRVFPGAWMVCLMVTAFLANDMLEADLSGGVGIFCVTFYLLAGWLVSMERELRRAEKTEGQRESV